jgi:hypothetical protein
MFTDMGERLATELRTRDPQLIHALFTDQLTQDQIKVWWQWGKKSSEREAQWLARQAARGDLSPCALLMALSAIWGRQGESITRVLTRFAIILEELGIITPYIRLLTREGEIAEERSRVRAVTVEPASQERNTGPQAGARVQSKPAGRRVEPIGPSN